MLASLARLKSLLQTPIPQSEHFLLWLVSRIVLNSKVLRETTSQIVWFFVRFSYILTAVVYTTSLGTRLSTLLLNSAPFNILQALFKQTKQFKKWFRFATISTTLKLLKIIKKR